MKTLLPTSSVLNIPQFKYHYIDSYQGVFLDPQNLVDSTMVAKAFFMSAPKWIDKLFALRNKLVSVFGLKTSGNKENKQELLDKFKCEPGEQLGLFKVYHKSENEVILGEDDKHLNFRVSLYFDKSTSDPSQKNLTISTTVVFNNKFGKLYFIPVRPFHRLIVPTMLKGTLKELENNTMKV